MRKKIFYIVSFLLFFSNVMNAQDAVFSQYFASGVYFNPALAAAETSLTISGISRTQWKSVGTPYESTMLALTIPIKDKFEKHKRLGGITVSVYDDKAGDGTLHTNGVNVSGAYGVNVTPKNLLFFGVMGGFYQKELNQANFQWGSQYNPLIGWDNTIAPASGTILAKKNYFDINAGLLVVHDLEKEVGTDRSEIYLSASTYHLNRANESLIENHKSKISTRWNVNVGALLPLKKHIGISPNLFYVHQGGQSQINTGIYLSYYFLKNTDNLIIPNNIEIGSWYRIKDSFIFNLGIGNEVYHLGFSYDMTSSDFNLAKGKNGAYEISLKLQKPHKKTERHFTPRF